MRSTIRYLIESPKVVLMGTGLLVLLGLFSFSQLRYTFFPKEPIEYVDVRMVWQGASPSEVEEGIVVKIEDAVKGITGVRRVTSTSLEGMGSVEIEMKEGADADEVTQDVKNAVDGITTFPERADEPSVTKREVLNRTLRMAVTGEVPRQALKDYAERMQEDLRAMDGISKVFLVGVPPEEIEIEVRENDLRAYNLTFAEVARAVRNANLETSGGEVKTGRENMLIRADQKGYYARDLHQLILRGKPQGEAVRLGDVANIHDRFSDKPVKRYLNGKPAVGVNLFTLNSEDILKNAERAKAYVEDFNQKHEAVKIHIVEDSTELLNARINTLADNGIMGAILVLVVLGLFLNRYLAFWVAFKIPVALLGMLILAQFYDLTINVVSMFGAIIVLGILVDDGVVVAENIYQHYQDGKKPLRAALDGTLEVIPPVLASLATTAVAFSLFFFVAGKVGDFFSAVAFVVIGTLAVALVESFFFLPSHIAHSGAMKGHTKQTKAERATNNSVIWVRDHLYTPALRLGLKYWPLTVVVAVALFIGSISLVGTGTVKTTFFPNVEQDVLKVDLELPPGTSEEVTEELLWQIDESVRKVNDSLSAQRADGKELVENVELVMGPDANEGYLQITLLGAGQRQRNSLQIASEIRQEVGNVPQARNLSYGNPALVFGKPVNIALVSPNLDNLREAKERLRAAMEAKPELKDVTDTDEKGIRELNVELTPRAELLGLSLGQVMQQVRAGFFGLEVQSLQRGDDEVKVWARYPKEGRRSVEQLQQMRIRVGQATYPLDQLATIEPEEGVQSIDHQRGTREIRVKADVANLDVAVPKVLAELEAGVVADILNDYPNMRYSLEGQARESATTQKSIKPVFPIVLLLMLSLIVINFQSFRQMLIVVAILPFCFVGVVLGHWIHGIALSMFSYVGMIALVGVLVNNSLVMVSAFNERLKEGMPFGEALTFTARSRFRAIMLTTITTVFGLGPLILEQSFTAQFLKPTAVAVAYGLAVGTFLTLLLLPVFLKLNNGLARRWGRLRQGAWPSAEAVEPAVQRQQHQMQDA
jgi:multidrug efflux pump subunit AcrB